MLCTRDSFSAFESSLVRTLIRCVRNIMRIYEFYLSALKCCPIHFDYRWQCICYPFSAQKFPDTVLDYQWFFS